MNSAMSDSDKELLELVSGPTPDTIIDVIRLMEAIDEKLTGDDGLKWFNLLYLSVTKQVNGHPPANGWSDAAWLTRLDVVFANLYFSAIRAFINGDASVPSAWNVLFEARHVDGIDRIQFALAGMNAHINRDLALALLQTDDELRLKPTHNSPEHDDFEHVNGLLEAVMPAALRTLATGIVGEIAQDTGKIGRLLAFWSVRAARDLAWDFSDHLRELGNLSRELALIAQDKVTGALGRSLLAVA